MTFVPVTLILVMLRVAVPVLVKVMACGELLVPTSWLGNVRLEGDKLTTGLWAYATARNAPKQPKARRKAPGRTLKEM